MKNKKGIRGNIVEGILEKGIIKETMSNMPIVDNLLVSLHDELHHFQTKKDGAEKGLLLAVSDLLDAKLSETERSLAADILIGLIQQVEQDVRSSLAMRLASRDDLHPNLLNYLAYGDIDIAKPVLLNSPLLADMDLMFIIQSKANAHWSAIASRNNISDRIIDGLASKQDVQTSLNLLKNETIEISEQILNKIVPLAGQSDVFDGELVNYKTLPSSIATSLYWKVSATVRHNIIDRFDIDAASLDIAIEDCVQDFSDTANLSRYVVPSNLMIEAADNYHVKGKITEKLLMDVLRKRQGRFFIALFAKKTGLKHQVVYDVMRQTGGQGLAVACRAVNVTKETFISLFLLCRTITQGADTKHVSASELKMAMRYYDTLTLKMAKEILTNSLT